MSERSRRPGGRAQGEVHLVTSAQEALSQEQSRRTRRYLISMSIRTACFVAVIFTRGWLQWACIAGAVVLPYLAVVAANAGRENDEFAGEPVTPASATQLPSSPLRIIAPREPGPDQP